MKRNLLILALLALVAVFIWPKRPATAPAVLATASRAPTSTATPMPPTPCDGCAQATQLAAAIMQAQLDLSALLATAPASPALATAMASGSAAETPAISKASVFWSQAAALPPYAWLANALATTSAADVTQSAAQMETDRQLAQRQLTPVAATPAAAAQQTTDHVISGTVLASAFANLQAQSDITQRPEPDTVLWMWLTPLFILVAAVLILWGATRGLALWQTGTQPTASR
jgi:hypothetical protein